MGYYTYYNLIVENSCEVIEERVIEAEKMLASMIDCDFVVRPSEYSEAFDWLSEDCLKWYDWEEDMIKLAKAFPEIEFCLYGKGEDGEYWRCFFKDDKILFQNGEIYYGMAPDWD